MSRNTKRLKIESEKEATGRTGRDWLTPPCTNLLCGVLEPKGGHNPIAVENILPGPIGKVPTESAKQLQASSSHGSTDKDPESLVLVHLLYW